MATQPIAANCLVDGDHFLVSIKMYISTSILSTAVSLTTFFGSTYVCEEAFSLMKTIA
jgi:hypothetical protein